MKPIVRKHSTEQEWLADKQKYIGASEIASLFGHGYQTYYELWHQKAGIIDTPDLDDNLAVLAGQCLEAGVADLIRKVKEVELRKSHRYLISPIEEARLACSLDYEQLTPDAGWCAAELKVMDFMSFADSFDETEVSGEYDPSVRFSLQLQQQLLITGKPYGYLYALVGNRQLIKVRMEADPDIQNLIVQRATEFWSSIAANNPPDPDLDKDLAVMYYTMTNVDSGRELLLHGDVELESSMVAYAEAAAREKAAKTIKDSIRSRMLDRIGPAVRMKLNNGSVSAKLTDRWGRDRRELRITPKRGLLDA